MDFKKISDEMFAQARDYVPLMEKTAFVEACAGGCFDRMEVRVGGDRVLPYYKENVERRSRYLMGALVKLYLRETFEPVGDEAYLMAADDYDRWAGGHIINQIERRKVDPAMRSRAFDLLYDYRELEKMLKTEIYSMLQAMNDPVGRMVDEMGKSLTPETLQNSVSELKSVQKELSILKEKRGSRE